MRIKRPSGSLQEGVTWSDRKKIKHKLIEMVQKNPKVSWESLEAAVDQWWSAATIRGWMTTRLGYKLYDEIVIALVTLQAT